MQIIESLIFTKKIRNCLPDEEYRLLQEALILKPDIGKVIPGTSGLRKLRWKISSKGKSGGIRVIYYLYAKGEIIYLITVFKKSVNEDLTQEQYKILSQYVKKGIL